MIIEKGIPTFVLILLILTSSVLTALGFNSYEPWITALLWTIGIILFFVCCIQTSNLNQIEIVLFILSLMVCMGYVYSRAIGHDISEALVKKGDAYGFWKRAVSYCNVESISRYTIMPYVLNLEFHIFDQNYLCCILFNVLFCELAIFNLLLYAGKKLRALADIFSITLICFYPYVFKIASSLWREAMYVLFLSFSFYFFMQYVENRKLRNLYLSVLLTVPVLLGHSGYFPIPLVYFVASLLMNDANNRKNIGVFVIELILLFVFVRIVMQFNSIDYLTGGKTSDIDDFFNRLAGSDSDLNAGSAYLVGFKASNWVQVFLFAPIRLMFYMFSPLPVNWRGLKDIGTFVFDSLLHIIIMYKAIRVLLRYRNTDAKNMNEYQIVKWGLLSYLSAAMVFAMGTRTAGTAIRHRDAVVAIELFVFINARYLENGIWQQQIEA